MASQQLYSYLGRAALWRNVQDRLAADGARLAPRDAKALKDLCAGATWMQSLPPALLASYRALYVVLRGCAADAEEEINRDILRTVRGVTGLLLDFSSDQRGELAGSINRVLNALAHVDNMGYCQGQNYVVDVMMKAGLPERETFCLFLYLLRQGHLHGIYRKEVPMLVGYMDKFEEKLRLRLPKLAAHFEAEHYPPPLYALEWMTTLFGLAAQPLISLVALDLILAGARNPVLRLCVALLGGMEEDLLKLDQEGLLEEFRSKAVAVDAEEVIVRALRDGGAKVGVSRPLGWSTGPDYLLVLRSRHCDTKGLLELREEAKKSLLVDHTALQDALLLVTRALGWDCLRTCWLKSCLAARSDHDRHLLASEALRFVISNGGNAKAAAFMLGVGGADANGVDMHLLSPLHLTGLYNRPDIARVLLMCGASPRLAGGIARTALARRGKLWSPLEMAEEACTEGGELDEAGVSVGRAALYVLRGEVCLQCNLKLPRPAPCDACQLTFCKSCKEKHFCVGKLDLPRGVPLSSTAAASASKAAAAAAAAAASTIEGEVEAGAEAKRGASGRSNGGRQTLWDMGSAIGDDWEALFEKSNANARGRGAGIGPGAAGVEIEEEWKPGKLKRADSAASKVRVNGDQSDAADPLIASPRPWSTMTSVLLGTWERQPIVANPKDRGTMFHNSAAFVRACYPAQTWLQYHMEAEMGLSLGGDRPRRGWGGPFRGLGMGRERFNPEILRVSTTTELHRRMSWVMAESGVPWEKGDRTWCCPECFILFTFNVFRHHCRGCGLVYCSAHAPPTPIPPDDRHLKLCWACVLEGAAPLPSPLVDDDDNDDEEVPSPLTEQRATAARGIGDDRSSRETATGARAAARGVAGPSRSIPTMAQTMTKTEIVQIHGREGRSPAGNLKLYDDDDCESEDDEDEDEGDDGNNNKNDQQQRRKSDGGGFLSALVSFIEVIAAPVSPVKSRGGRGDSSRAPRPRDMRNTANRPGERNGRRTPALAREVPTNSSRGEKTSPGRGASTRAPPPREARPVTNGLGPRNGTRTLEPNREVSTTSSQEEKACTGIAQRASVEIHEASTGPTQQAHSPAGGLSPERIGDNNESGDWRGGWTPLHSNRQQEYASPRQRQTTSESWVSTPSSNRTGDEHEYSFDGDLLGRGGDSRISEGMVILPGEVEPETPAELGFPSERPWAYGFGSG